ncbi:hypothetical protein ABTN24_19970, partial [Acinetobacter baumannii]
DYSASPFPHIVFRNFFPDDFYRDLIKSEPTEGYDKITASGSRLALRLYGEHIAKVEAKIRPAWEAVSAMLTSKEVEQAIRDRL